MKTILTLIISILLFTGCNNSSSSNTNSNTNTTTSTQKDMRIHPDGTINIAPSISGVALTIVDENSLYDFTPKAVDEYKDTILTFSITNKPEWATFNTTTGNLNGTPSFTDGERYANVVISVSDEIHTSSLPPFDIVVTNINRIPIITSNETANVQENQIDALTVTATDEDEDTLIYSLSGIDADAFNMDESTNVITFKIAPDFETKNLYEITLTVSDDIDTVTQDIIINILDINESPTITSNSTVNVEENTQFVLTITATDIDNNTLLYSISGGVDQALFTIDANSGVLSFVTGRDFENPTDDDTNNTYIVNVTATDDGTGNLTDTQTITVTVTDVVENQAPVITSNATQNVDENQTDAFTITATDVDADTLTYSLTGVDAAAFNINATTGVVIFINAPDFEIPIDDDGNNTYLIVANVSDGTEIVTQNVTVTISDVINNPFQIAKLISKDAQEVDSLGKSISISGDYIVAGAPNEDTNADTLDNAGSAYIFKRDALNNELKQIAKIQAHDAEENDKFGSTVAISGDYIVVGSPYEDTTAGGLSSAGSTYVFKRNSDSENDITQIAKIQASDAEASDQFGYSVSISGNYIVVGAHKENPIVPPPPASGLEVNDAGSVYLFKIDTTNNSVAQISKIQASDAQSNDNFGFSVSINENYILVGAPNEDTPGSNAGSAYIFKMISDTQIIEIKKVQAIANDSSDDTENDAQFGYSVSISGDYFVIGASSKDGASDANIGSAYVYKINSDDPNDPNAITHIKKIEASDAAADDKFGHIVSISGNYIVVGVPNEDTAGNLFSAGSAYIFKKDISDNVTQIKKIEASDPQAMDYFGYAVSIDKNHIAVGSVSEDTAATDAGSAYIFDIEPLDKPYIYNAPISTMNYDEQYFNTLVYNFEAASPSGGIINFDLSGDDGSKFSFNNSDLSYLLKADYEDPEDTGIDNEYNISITATNENNNTTNIDVDISVQDKTYFDLAKFQADDIAIYDNFGDSVAIDGNYIVIGATNEAPLDGGSTVSGAGSAYLYEKQSNGSVVQIAKFQASDPETDDHFGNSVAISGNYIVVGAFQEDTPNTTAGSAYVFKIDGATVTEIAKIQSTNIEGGDYFGISVAISGEYIVVGAREDDYQGRAFLFKLNTTTDTVSQEVKFQADDAANNDAFGNNISIDGNYIVASASSKNSFAGNAYLFKIDYDVAYGIYSVIQIAKLEADDAENADYFGRSVAISGDYIVVGADGEDPNAIAGAGSAYLFKRNSDTVDDVTQIAKINATDPEVSDQFGISISISGDYIIVGAYRENAAEKSNAGSAYLFKIEDTVVNQVVKIQGNNPEVNAEFGKSVSINGDFIVIGAHAEDTTATDAGSAYLFIRDLNQP